jgi:hypothetical protein
MDVNLQTLQVAGAFVGGGLAGAIITNIVTVYRARLQPVGKRIDVAPLFSPGFTAAALSPTITVSDGTRSYQLNNLHVADIQITNRGNRDMPTFKFGITLSGGDGAVHVEGDTQDRHHIVEHTSVTPAAALPDVDFTLTPLNRGDAYTIKVFVVAAGGKPGVITISSSEAVRFVEMPSLTETLSAVARASAIEIGPFKVGLK